MKKIFIGTFLSAILIFSSACTSSEKDPHSLTESNSADSSTETTPSAENEKAEENEPQIFAKDFDGIVLTVKTDKSEYRSDDVINVTASVKNTTEESVHLFVPTSSPNSHSEIKTEIVRGKMYLIDTDIDKAMFFDDTAVLSIEPGDEYVQDMRFETYFYESDYGKKPAETGLYTGTGAIRVLTDPDGLETIRYSIEFSLTLK